MQYWPLMKGQEKVARIRGGGGSRRRWRESCYSSFPGSVEKSSRTFKITTEIKSETNGGQLSYLDLNIKRVNVNSAPGSPLVDWVVGDTLGTIQQRSSSSLFCDRPSRPLLGIGTKMSTQWRRPTSILSAHHRRHPPSHMPWRMVLNSPPC